jgi:hypothetical protein
MNVASHESSVFFSIFKYVQLEVNLLFVLPHNVLLAFLVFVIN